MADVPRAPDAVSTGRPSGRNIVENPATVPAAIAFVVLFRYFILSLWHVWSLANGRGGLLPTGGDDGDYYLRTALDLAQGWTGTVVTNIYPAAVGWMMRTTGIYSVLFYKHLNLLAGFGVLGIGLLLYRQLRRWDAGDCPTTGDDTSRALLVLLFGLYASSIAYETFSLTRDGWIYLTHLLAIGISLQVTRRRGLVRVALLVVLLAVLALLYKLRFYGPIGFVVGVIGWWTWPILRRRFSARGAVIAITAVLGAALFVLLVGTRTFAANNPVLASIALGSYRSGDPAAAGSNLGIDLVRSPPLLQLPLFLYSTISNVLGPLPWQIRNVSTAAGFVVEVPMLSFVLWRIWQLREQITRLSSFLVWQAIAWFLVIGYFNDNLGTAFRLRVLGWHALFVLYPLLRQREVDAAASAASASRPVTARE